MGTGGDACGFWLFGVNYAFLPHYQTDLSFRHQCKIKFCRCAVQHGRSAGLVEGTRSFREFLKSYFCLELRGGVEVFM